uniref:Uncharacterized protein n=1 Tax=Aplanochytrium stocchinoi TaxID=215587 RepID=A0A6S8BLN4_9STRA|mmetsp:Transcript_27124/g.32958  ORF Transcript_27124/g.32958 Transcript_27124/m.32958 type:complete len:152 (+) Transcript_27124:137-592(+)
MKKIRAKILGDPAGSQTGDLSDRFLKIVGELQTESTRISEFEQMIAAKERENKQLEKILEAKKSENKKLASRVVDTEAIKSELEKLKRELKEKDELSLLKEEDMKKLKASNEFLARLSIFTIAVVPLGLYAESQNMNQLIKKLTNLHWSKL